MEFRVAKGWAIFIYITAPLILCSFIYLLFFPLFSDTDTFLYFLVLLPVSLGMIFLILIGLLDTINGKLIIDQETVQLHTTLSKRKLKFNQIKGFKTDDKHVYIVSGQDGLKNIKVSLYFGNIDKLMFWLESNFVNLNLQNQIEQEADVLENYDFGRNAAERADKLNQAKKVATVINWMASIAAAWAFFYPVPYEIVILLNLLFPAVGVIVLFLYKGLIHMDENAGSAYPSLAYAIIFPSMALVLRAVLDFNILSYTNFWPVFILISISFLLIPLLRTKELNYKTHIGKFTFVSLLLITSAYGFGAVITVNCTFDNSLPETYSTLIMDKSISRSSGISTYYLDVSPCGPEKNISQVVVSQDLYKSALKGEETTIYLGKGWLNIPWFYTTK